MAAVFLSAAVTCFAVLFLGQAALRLAGAQEWSWLAPAVGLSLAMLVATPTVHVPGRALTVAIVLGLLSLAAAVWCLRSPPHRPPLAGFLAALPVALLTMVPFLAADRGGVLGTTVNNDVSVHLVFVEGFISSAVTAITPLPRDYPMGPHAMAALLSKGLGIHADFAFSGWTMAVPIIGAWTTQAVVRGGSWFGRLVVATVAGMPFLIAAYYGEGSFKEVGQAAVVLAIALSVAGYGPRLGRGRWVPLALLTGGVISVYSLPGLPWVLAILGIWCAGQLVIEVRRGRLRQVPAAVRRELPALGIGVGVLIVALLPQARRMYEFLALREGTGIKVDDLGNLVGPLPGWESLGVWDSVDFRLPATHAYSGGVWSIFVLALVVFGAYWAFRRGRWVLPLSAAAAMAIWKLSAGSQSPYVVAKALLIASPLLLIVAALPLVDRDPARESVRAPGRWRWAWLAVPALALALLVQVVRSDLRALRFSPVRPDWPARQLETFRSELAGKRTLVLGISEFIPWELASVPTQPVALVNLPEVPLRPRKHWDLGQALDFDSLPVSTLNEYEWIVTPRDAAGSAPPAQLRLVDSTEDFLLWKRVGRIPERSILDEGEWPGRVLRCGGAEGRAIVAKGGVAAVRRPPITAAVDPMGPGQTVAARIGLPAGKWQLEAPYTSHLPVEVTAPGLQTTLPANLEWSGPRLPIGRIDLPRAATVPISFHSEDTWLAPSTATTLIDRVIATRVGEKDRVVPIAEACGKYVDWYRPGS